MTWQEEQKKFRSTKKLKISYMKGVLIGADSSTFKNIS